MGKPFFAFLDRVVTVHFFEEEPVKLTLIISDKVDEKLIKCTQAMLAADKEEYSKRLPLYEAALSDLIGADSMKAILERSENYDCFAIYEVFNYILSTYQEEKRKKLTGSAR